MSPNLIEKGLKAKYPKLMQWLREAPGKAMVSDYGIQCGDGWLSIIGDLCNALQDGADAGHFPQPIVSQITQAGRLRVEVDNVSSDARPEVDALLVEANERSAATCEVCGAPGVLRWQHGVQTVCHAHATPGSRAVEDGDFERVLAARRAAREARTQR